MSELDLPNGWHLTEIESILAAQEDGKIVHQGWSPQCDREPAAIGEWGVLKTTAIQDGYFLENENKRLPKSKDPKPRIEVKPGDLLVTNAGPRSRCGVICFVDATRAKLMISGKMYRLRFPADHINPKFVESWLRTSFAQKQINDRKTGISESGLNMTQARFLTLAAVVAPIAEQKVIADKLDTLLAQVENTKARLERIPQILKRFRQSVLAAALEGGLIGENKPSTAGLSTFVEIHNGARKPVSAKVREGIQGNIPYYGATGIVDHLNDYTHEGRFLLVGEDGANLLSKTKDLAFIAEGKIWVNNHAHVLRQKEGVNLDFIKVAINSLDLAPWVTGSAQPKLTKKSLQALPVPSFSFEKQCEIVRRVDQLFAYADTIEKQINNALAQVEHLTQSILAKAFRGELTEQWRKDNPDLISGDNSAQALLERIQAERAATKKIKRTRSKSASA